MYKSIVRDEHFGRDGVPSPPADGGSAGDGDCSAGAYVKTPRYGSFKDPGVLTTSSTICRDK